MTWGKWAAVLAALCAFGCSSGGGGGGDVDAGPPTCAADRDCDDGIFCNGIERCDPEATNANALGCASTGSPCLASQSCDESGARCTTLCGVETDADGDGVVAIECGGTDCDDADGDRFPGNTEVCDALGHDEDCDSATLGDDTDGDGYVSAACCNGDRCGLDCDDALSGVNPEAVEACNGVDEDCDGTLDEGALSLFFRDVDGDGFGDPTSSIMRACVDDPLFTAQADDCDDRDRTIFPGAPELCDGLDNDCNLATPFDEDADRDGHLPADASCSGGDLPRDDCDEGDALIHGESAERCNGLDDDCDGMVDEDEANDACTALARSGDDQTAVSACGGDGTGTCAITACDTERADCDENLVNGCEVDLLSDDAHCGRCGAACGTGSCVDGFCVVGSGSPPPSDAVALRRGTAGGCALLASGHARCWGEANLLERGAAFVRDAAGEALGDIHDLSLGKNCRCYVLDADGDDRGDLFCDGTFIDSDVGSCALIDNGELFRTTPVDTGISDASQVVLSRRHGCVVRGAGGAVECWGEAGYLGISPATRSDTPVAVRRADGQPLTGVTALDAGMNSTCAIVGATREVWCWGAWNASGILGRGTFAEVPGEPRAMRVLVDHGGGPVPLLADDITVGAEHACALDGGEPYCWGANGSDQLTWDAGATESTYATAIEVDPGGSDPWRSITAGQQNNGNDHQVTCGVREEAGSPTLRCWGASVASGCSARPVPCTVPLAAERDPGGRFTLGDVTSPLLLDEAGCAIVGGWPYCWGSNDRGQLGSFAFALTTEAAIPVGRGRVREISAANSTACAVSTSGEVSCWGRNRDGAGAAVLPPGFGDPAELDATLSALPITGLAGPARAVSVGGAVACALLGDGTVSCWGGHLDADQERGLLVGAAVSTTPVSIPGLTDSVQVSVGDAHGCAVQRGGDVFCWGLSAGGALGGDGPDTCALGECARTAQRVSGLPAPAVEVRAVGIAAIGSASTSCARLEDGRIYCWGEGAFGALGDGTASSREAPQPVAQVDDAVAFDGESSLCARRASGTIACWGLNLASVLGPLSNPESCGVAACAKSPVDNPLFSDVALVAVGLLRTCVQLGDGQIWCWGGEGFLDLDDTGPVPFGPVEGIAFADQLAVSQSGHCALVSGAVYCWGALSDIVVTGRSEVGSELPVTAVPGL